MSTTPNIKDKLELPDIEATIEKEQYHHFPGTNVTVCCLTLKNGFAVIGESSCVASKNFNDTTGRVYARRNAITKIWMLEGYLLKTIHKEYGIYQD